MDSSRFKKFGTAVTAVALTLAGMSFTAPAQAATVTPNGDLQAFTTTVSTNQVIIPSGDTSITLTDTQECATQQASTYMWYNFFSGIGGPITTINDSLSDAEIQGDGNIAVSTKTYNLTIPGEYTAYSYGAGFCSGPWYDPNTSSYYETSPVTIEVYDTPSFNNTSFGDLSTTDTVQWDASAYGWGIAYTVTAGTLPDGLTLDPIYGTITGTPTTAGAYDFTITGTNPAGTASQQYTGTVTAGVSADIVTSLSFDKSQFGPGETSVLTINGNPSFSSSTYVGCYVQSVNGYGILSTTTFLGGGNSPVINNMVADPMEPIGEVGDLVSGASVSADYLFGGLSAGAIYTVDFYNGVNCNDIVERSPDATASITLTDNIPTPGSGFVFDKSGIGQGESANLSFVGDATNQAGCIAIDGAILYCGPVGGNGNMTMSWDDAQSYITMLGLDPSVSHTVTFTSYNASDVDQGTFTPVQGATPTSTANLTISPAAPVGPTAPSRVDGANVTNVTDTTAHVTWNAADGATSYNVYVNGTLVGTTSDLSIDLTGLTGSTDYTVSIEAVNEAGATAGLDNHFTTEATVVVPPVVPAPVFGNGNVTLTPGTAGSNLSGSAAATSGDNITYTVKNGNTLPAGLALDPATGAITGTPTTPGDYTFVIVATNAGGSAEVTVTLHIASAPVVPPVVIHGKTIKITFGPDSAKLSTSAKKALKALVATAHSKGLTEINVTAYGKKVAGRTTADRNRVAKARAAAIVKYLKSLDSSLTVTGVGKSQGDKGRTGIIVLKDGVEV
jgi:hypothetical protein